MMGSLLARTVVDEWHSVLPVVISAKAEVERLS
jgi:hypothetical protein